MAADKPRIAILAAGASTRLGQPKALAPLPGGTPLARLVAAAQRSSDARPVLVTGRHATELAAAVQEAALDVELVTNPQWSTGRTSSLIAAVRHCPNTDLLVVPVDHPRIRAELMLQLLEAWTARNAPPHGWLAPASPSTLSKSAELRPGHPVLIGRSLLAQLTGDPSWPARSLRDLRQLADPLWCVEVRSAHDALAIHENLDTPADLAELTARDLPSEP